MHDRKLDALILQLETYLECWKQFNRGCNLAHAQKFSAEDESQFLEVKSIIVQNLEHILALVDNGTPTRAETHALIAAAPSLRAVSHLDEAQLKQIENQWHKIYIAWHSILGQLKVRQRNLAQRSPFAAWFGKKS
ncbi:MAG: hypothetical protein RL380_1263 [Verrucomicrobiota bacterium]|jgi:hypothetical protein